MLANLFIVAAPSGAGKTSLVNALVQSTADVKVSISHTTRQPRPGEEQGKNYFFITEQEFTNKVAQAEFLEYARVYGNLYGTSRAWVEEQLYAGVDVILEIDWQGARQIKNKFLQSIGIFILPPSSKILHQRLENRAQDHHEVITERMAHASDEMSHFDEYDYVIINDDYETALMELRSIIIANRCKKEIQAEKYKGLIKDLLL